MNAVISARLASPMVNRSVSPLRGIAWSPSRIPATNTATKPEPWTSAETP